MLTKGNTKGTIRFALKPSHSPKIVQLAGDFNNWKPIQMRGEANRVFAIDVPLRSGSHQYKFIVDGQWVPDPDNTLSTPNSYGTVNSVARVV